MKRFASIIISAAFAVTFLLSACSEKVLVDGNYCDALTAKEEAEFIDFARLTLLNSPDKFNARQKEVIRNTRPTVQIDYTGDRRGKAIFTWMVDNQSLIRFSCEGKFLTKDMQISSKLTKISEAPGADGKINIRDLTFEPFKED